MDFLNPFGLFGGGGKKKKSPAAAPVPVVAAAPTGPSQTMLIGGAVGILFVGLLIGWLISRK